jgi:hypothetical protein
MAGSSSTRVSMINSVPTYRTRTHLKTILKNKNRTVSLMNRKGPSEGFEPSSSGIRRRSGRPQPPILTRLYYEGQLRCCSYPNHYIIVRRSDSSLKVSCIILRSQRFVHSPHIHQLVVEHLMNDMKK